MLIVEGTDGVGKTTLAHELCRRLPGWVYSHFSRLPDEFHRYHDYLPFMARRQVMDRFHMSEIAYAEARGDEQIQFPEQYKLLDARLRLFGAYTVVVTATNAVLEATYHDKQMYDLALIKRANVVFQRIVSKPTYVDWDCVIVAERDHFPSDSPLVDQIVEDYLQRQSLITTLNGGNCREPLSR